MAGTSRKNCVVEIDELLRRDDLQITLQTPTSIFKLPDSLTKSNPQAYSPSRLFLGPFHELKPELHKMEIFKLEIAKQGFDKFYLTEFTQMVDQLKELEVQIRACYDGNLAVESEALAWRILIDGLFLLRLLLAINNSKEKKGKSSNRGYKYEMPFFNEQQLYDLNLEGNLTITHHEFIKDLLKLENQIPIQILKRVLPKHLVEHLDVIFYKFCISVSPLPLFSVDENPFEFPPDFRRSFPSLSEILDQSQHLLHFLHTFIFYERFFAYGSSGEYRSSSILADLLNLIAKILGIGLLKQLVEALGLIQTLIGFIGRVNQSSSFASDDSSLKFPSASKLKKVGVKFRGGGSGCRFHDESATLTLPIITINAFCEVILRNLVALEVEAKLNLPCLSHYVKLMSGLTSTAEDVRILKRAGIIAGGCSGDEDDIVKMFKELGNDAVKVRSTFDDGVLSRANLILYQNYELDIMEEINGYYENRWVVKAERFGKKYICPVIQALIILVALILILIVAIRTVCGWFSCPKILGHSLINAGYYIL